MLIYCAPSLYNHASVSLARIPAAFNSGNQQYDQAFAYVSALTQQDANTAIIDIRCINDSRKDVAAIPRRGTLPQLWNEICAWNSAGFGIFCTINEMDGSGRYEIANVQTLRAQAVDLDNLSAMQNYQLAAAWNPPPSFAVQSSPGKAHVYWQTTHHNDRDKFTLLQRKLRTLFDGDKTIIDPSRVLRLPGTLHLKNPQQPHLVTCWALSGYGKPIDPSILEIALANINITDGSGGRRELGDPSQQAPGWDWCLLALNETNPNDLDRGEWVSFTAAWKQAAWNFAPEQQLFDAWSQWCARYATNDPKENIKNWQSIRNSEVGWPSLERRIPNLHALRIFGEKKAEMERKTNPLSSDVPSLPMPHEQQRAPQSIPIPTGEILTPQEQREWFKGCVFIEARGQILTRSGRYMNQTQFNGTFGGKRFVVDGIGNTANKPWEAATNSTQGTIPKADHTRFLPSRPHGELIVNAIGRVGVNTYKPANVDARPGDISPFWNHLCAMIPDENDRNILLDYFAHNIKYPGFKIPWAPVIQSTEGIGKNLFKLIMERGLGETYVYHPDAKQLVDSGAKFNAWLREQLFIIANEIKVDEKRDMIEILKPMITETRIEIQGKGIDQAQDDNFANWMFFTNYKDAIPINKNGRRYAVFFSALQSHDDLLQRGMNDAYFKYMFEWMQADGAAHVVHWLKSRAIERGAIPMRAPDTTSKPEALQEGLSDVAVTIQRMIDDEQPGFRKEWANSIAVERDWPKYRPGRATPRPQDIGKAIAELGYRKIGRAGRAYFADHPEKRAVLWFKGDRNVEATDYPIDQGYGDPAQQQSNVVPLRPLNG